MRFKRLFLILILLIAAFLRFYNLGEMPYGITNDEAGYIYNAYSISQTLRDANGKLLPLSINLDNPFSPVPIYLNAIFIRILGLSVFSGRFVYAFLGVGCVLLVFLLAKNLFGNDKIALASAFGLAISPWHLHISRSAYEAGAAMFFFLLAFLVFLKNLKKDGNINRSLPFFPLAFFSYHATKIFFIPFIFILVLSHRNLFKRKKELIFFLAGIAIIIFSFFYIGKKQDAFGRASTFLFNDLSTAAKVVDAERQKSSAPFFIRQVFSNKPLYFLRVMRENYLSAFSPQFLFLYGETSGGGIYGTFFRGEMYIIELPLLVLGLFILFRRYKKARNVVFFSLLAAPLTTTFTVDATYVMRAVMMIPFLYFLVGLGIFTFLSYIDKYSWLMKKTLIIALVVWYLFLLLSYLYQYHFRYSVYGAEYWFQSSRELATLIKDSQDDYDEIQIVRSSPMFIFQYGVFAKVNPEKIQETWKSEPPRRLENIVFLNDCVDTKETPLEFLPPKSLYVTPEECHKQAIPSAEIKEFGEPLRTIWKIYFKGS